MKNMGMVEVLNNATSRHPSGSWFATGLKAFPNTKLTVRSPLAALWTHSGGGLLISLKSFSRCRITDQDSCLAEVSAHMPRTRNSLFVGEDLKQSR